MKFLCINEKFDCFWTEEGCDYEQIRSRYNDDGIVIHSIKPFHMFFKHYATDEIIEVKTIVNTSKEIIVEKIDGGDMFVVFKNKKHERYQVKGTSFLKIE